MTTWLVIAAAILITELFLGTVYLLVVSLAAAGAGLVAAFFGDSVSIPLFTAALLSALGIACVHTWLKRRRPTEKQADNDLDIGQNVQILQRLHDGRYEVAYRGTHWQAQAVNHDHGHAAESAVIVGKQANTLLIHLHQPSQP
ncbi:NfeD family protein [Neisseria lisongii]|uniref:NfeD family protein n=1 Tax=Neisseria lisongii TaxID=2912188 RepID=A0AAW5AGU1_9NEIS|nr:NfeD family protein [Neisseria lisongii]MCF7528851.1 NfeD family protein [Neisseria lisongii]